MSYTAFNLAIPFGGGTYPSEELDNHLATLLDADPAASKEEILQIWLTVLEKVPAAYRNILAKIKQEDAAAFVQALVPYRGTLSRHLLLPSALAFEYLWAINSPSWKKPVNDLALLSASISRAGLGSKPYEVNPDATALSVNQVLAEHTRAYFLEQFRGIEETKDAISATTCDVTRKQLVNKFILRVKVAENNRIKIHPNQDTSDHEPMEDVMGDFVRPLMKFYKKLAAPFEKERSGKLVDDAESDSEEA